MSTSGFSCSVCEKSFAIHSNLRKHVKSHRPDQIKEIAPSKIKNKYNCEYCSESFKNKRRLIKHHKAHNYGKKCPLCKVIDLKPALIQHFTLVHNVDINIEHHDFYTIEEFNSWKKQIEEENSIFFMQDRGAFKSATYTQTKYHCNRSGTYQSKGQGLRSLKIQGSIKIDAFCPASIILVYKNDVYSVKYTSTHIGHKNELCHIKLPEKGNLIMADGLDEIAPNKIKYQCVACPQEFHNYRIFKRHLVTHGIHSMRKELPKCPLCDWKSIEKELIKHIKENHDIDIRTENKEFKSMEDFQCWKREIEKDTCFTFINDNGIIKTIDHTKIKYTCHRSGTLKSKGVGLRQHMPNKRNAFCPASMEVTIKEGRWNVLFTETHIGHDDDSVHLNAKDFLSGDEINVINLEDPETLEPIKKKRRTEILSRHENVVIVKENFDTQFKADANNSNKMEESETLEGIQDILSRYNSVEDNCDISIADDSIQLVGENVKNSKTFEDAFELFVNDTMELVEKPETLEELKEKMKRTFLEALDKAMTFEQCELIRKIIAPLHPTLDKCIPKDGIQIDLDHTPTKCISEEGIEELDSTPVICLSEVGTQTDLHPTTARCISEKGTVEKLLDPTLVKRIPEEGIEFAYFRRINKSISKGIHNCYFRRFKKSNKL
ncbi:PREDICTED: uncharacterized protein LOC108559860 isoform X2 [Nicrophorus vespilloides]|uniref:Uncharacterized protein LOC108559860 isoform X2 n=1 Tax=Nicrophorus vespilloides TaxID=110193 RepID=A0ABM1MDR8_NICVS|nr:PREDICTED: uncharacterized protein LOC108559860 isoform X2 [Nicrophorus vespilloides]